MSKSQYREKIRLIRYADDFVVLHENLAVIGKCKEIITSWLKDIGLKLKPSKTKITHTLIGIEGEKPGFNFLGFNIRQYPVGKHHCGKSGGKGKSSVLLGYKTFIKPSSKRIKQHWEEVSEIIDKRKVASQEELIKVLNPVIKGWANYYRIVNSSETYSHLDNLIWQKLRAWVNRRHPNKSAQWKGRKYWKTLLRKNWIFATKMESNDPIILSRYSDTSIKQKEFVKVEGSRSPYDGDLVYWSTRMGKHPECSKTVATLLRRQKGKCPYCGLYFQDGDVWEIDHIHPRALGGQNSYTNIQLLHQHCHTRKTSIDIKKIRSNVTYS